MTSQALEVRQDTPSELSLPSAEYLSRELGAIRAFQQLVHQQLIKGVDYGVIPGTGTKPTLLKPGAEKLSKLLGMADHYEIAEKVEDWDRPLFRYVVKCQLRSVRSGTVISESFGECNSMESKYRWRESSRRCPDCGSDAIIAGKREYGGGFLCFKKKGGCGAKFADGDTRITGQASGKVPNDDIFSLINTILKMAQKRALVGAALSAGRLSEIFTQDLDELPEYARRMDDDAIEGEVIDAPPARAPHQNTARAPQRPSAPSQSSVSGNATAAQVNAIYAVGRQSHRWDTEETDQFSVAGYGRLPAELTKREASELIDQLKTVEQPTPADIAARGQSAPPKGQQSTVVPPTPELSVDDLPFEQPAPPKPEVEVAVKQITGSLTLERLDRIEQRIGQYPYEQWELDTLIGAITEQRVVLEGAPAS